MILRTLILLMTLNAIFPSAVIASACALNPSKSAISQFTVAHDVILNDKKTFQQGASPSLATNIHSHHPDRLPCDTPCCDTSDAEHSMKCDSGCCASGLIATAVLPSIALPTYSYPASFKPISGSIHFYTHTISPELRPPLV